MLSSDRIIDQWEAAMGLTKWGFIYSHGDEDDAERRDIVGSDACVLVTVGVTAVTDAPAVAVRLLEEGVELIELCGAFGPVDTAAVVDAVEGKVPVGGVVYGGEATSGLARLFG